MVDANPKRQALNLGIQLVASLMLNHDINSLTENEERDRHTTRSTQALLQSNHLDGLLPEMNLIEAPANCIDQNPPRLRWSGAGRLGDR